MTNDNLLIMKLTANFEILSESQSQNRSVTTVKATCALKDRPALRLDSRLVCKYEVLAVIGKGSFSQVRFVTVIELFGS
ncbi:unnamed protein product [Onchocerca flexuosa]|uniref:Protein kinase domain-containing protein n=1 Tax=Onchocerca flexuosa TaxID=387005 RepID=A0A183HQB9_9BILA|nr:unnamed protein product [Onchocerca flexuosa]